MYSYQIWLVSRDVVILYNNLYLSSVNPSGSPRGALYNDHETTVLGVSIQSIFSLFHMVSGHLA